MVTLHVNTCIYTQILTYNYHKFYIDINILIFKNVSYRNKGKSVIYTIYLIMKTEKEMEILKL